MRACSLFIIDEKSMLTSSILTTVDRALRSSTDRDAPFGGKVCLTNRFICPTPCICHSLCACAVILARVSNKFVLHALFTSTLCHLCTFNNQSVILCGDFAQLPPVVKGGREQECLAASILSSPLYKTFEKQCTCPTAPGFGSSVTVSKPCFFALCLRKLPLLLPATISHRLLPHGCVFCLFTTRQCLHLARPLHEHAGGGGPPICEHDSIRCSGHSTMEVP